MNKINNKKKLGILVFVSFFSLIAVLIANNGINANYSKKINQSSLGSGELSAIPDLKDWFTVNLNGANNIKTFKDNVTLSSRVSYDRIPGDHRTISLPVQETKVFDSNTEPYGFTKLQYVAKGVGSLEETRSQINTVFRAGGEFEPTEFKLASVDSWIILSILVNKYKYTFSNTQRFNLENNLDFSFGSSYLSNITVNSVLPIGYVKPYPDWGYSFQQFVDLGSDAQFNGNVDFRGTTISNLNVSADVSNLEQLGTISNYQVDSTDILKQAGYLPFATAGSISVGYGSKRNLLTVGLFGLYGGKYITGGSLGKAKFLSSSSIVSGTLNENLIHYSELSKNVNGVGQISYHSGNTGISLNVDQGFLVGQWNGDGEFTDFDLTGVTISNTANSNKTSKWLVNPLEALEVPDPIIEGSILNQAEIDEALATHNYASNLMLGNPENATTNVIDQGEITPSSTIGTAGYGEQFQVSSAGNGITINWSNNIGTIAFLKGYPIIKDIVINNTDNISPRISLGTESDRIAVPSVCAGFLIGYGTKSGSLSEISNISVNNLTAAYYQDMDGVKYYGSLYLSQVGGLFGRINGIPQNGKNIVLNNIKVVSEFNNIALINSRFNANENYISSRVFGELLHTVGSFASTFSTDNSTEINSLWENIHLINNDVDFKETSSSFNYSSPLRVSNDSYGTGLFATNLSHTGITFKDITVDNTSSVNVNIKYQNHGANTARNSIFGTFIGKAATSANMINLENSANLSFNVEDSILGANQWYKASDAGAVIISTFGINGEGKRKLDNIVNNGDILVRFSTTTPWKNTFVNKGRTYDDIVEVTESYNFAANMIGADSEIYVLGVIYGTLAHSGGSAENITNKGDIILEFDEQQVSVRTQQLNPYVDAIASNSRVGGVSLGGSYGNDSWINKISNYGNIFIGGTGLITAAKQTNFSTLIDNAYGSNKKPISRNILKSVESGFGYSWGGIYNKLGVGVGGVFGSSLTVGPSSATNISNFGQIRVYSSTVESVGGVAASMADNAEGTTFVANLANYGDVLVYSPYRGWRSTTDDPFLVTTAYASDRVRIAGIIGGFIGSVKTNIEFITNVMNYGYISIPERAPKELTKNGVSFDLTADEWRTTDGGGSDPVNQGTAWRMDVADIMGGQIRYNGTIVANGETTWSAKNLVLNAGSRPTKDNAGSSIANYDSTDTNYVTREGWGAGVMKNGTTTTVKNYTGTTTFISANSGYYLMRGGQFALYGGAWTYQQDNMDTVPVENTGPNIYLKYGNETSAAPTVLSTILYYKFRGASDRRYWSDSTVANYWAGYVSMYHYWYIQNTITDKTSLEKYFNGFIDGIQGSSWLSQIAIYSPTNTDAYAKDNMTFSKGSLVLGINDPDNQFLPRKVLNLSTDEMMPIYAIPYLYGYPFVGTALNQTNQNYRNRTVAGMRLEKWKAASANIVLNNRTIVIKGQYYIGDSPTAEAGSGSIDIPTTSEEILAATYSYSPKGVVSQSLTYDKLKELVDSLVTKSSPRYSLSGAKYYYSRDNITWIEAGSGSQLHKLVIGHYYVRIVINSVPYAGQNDPELKKLSISSSSPVFHIIKPSVNEVEVIPSNYQYSDVVYLYDDDLYNLWKAYFPIYAKSLFIEETSSYNALKLDDASEMHYKDITSISYRKGEEFDSSYAYSDIWQSVTIPTGYFPNGFILDGGAGVKNVASISNLNVGHYQLKLVYKEVEPSFNNFLVDWTDNGKGTDEMFSQTEKIIEFDIAPRDIAIEWGEFNSTEEFFIESDTNKLIYKNEDFKVGALFSSNSLKYTEGVTIKYTNADIYTEEEAIALGNELLKGKNKPLDLSNVGTHTIIASFYRGDNDVSFNYIGYQDTFTYKIIERSIIAQWSNDSKFQPMTGSEITIYPTISQINLYQLDSIKVNSDLSGLIYEGNSKVTEGVYHAKLVGVVDINGIDISSNLNIQNYNNATLLDEGFAWRIVPSDLEIKLVDSVIDADLGTPGIQIEYGKLFGYNDFIISVSSDAIEYKNISSSTWDELPSNELSLTPGTYQFRSFIDLTEEKIYSLPIEITIIKGNLNFPDTINVGTFEKGGAVNLASDLPLPISKNGKWQLENPNLVISTGSITQVVGTLVLNENEKPLYNEKSVIFTFTFVEQLTQLEFIEDSTIKIAGDRLEGIDLSKPLTIQSLKDEIFNVNGIVIKDTQGNAVVDPNRKIGTGFTLSFQDHDYSIVISGDIDGSGDWTLADSENIFGYINSDVVLNALQLDAADLNGDFQVNGLDFVVSILISEEKHLETIQTVKPVATTSSFKKDEDLF